MKVIIHGANYWQNCLAGMNAVIMDIAEIGDGVHENDVKF